VTPATCGTLFILLDIPASLFEHIDITEGSPEVGKNDYGKETQKILNGLSKEHFT